MKTKTKRFYSLERLQKEMKRLKKKRIKFSVGSCGYTPNETIYLLTVK